MGHTGEPELIAALGARVDAVERRTDKLETRADKTEERLGAHDVNFGMLKGYAAAGTAVGTFLAVLLGHYLEKLWK